MISLQVRSSFLKSIGCRRMASNQDTVINIGRKMSRAGVNHSYMLRRNSSQASGSMTVSPHSHPHTLTPSHRHTLTLQVGGFVAPTATPLQERVRDREPIPPLQSQYHTRYTSHIITYTLNL